MDRYQNVLTTKPQIKPAWIFAGFFLSLFWVWIVLPGFAAESSPLDFITLLEKSLDLETLYLPPGYSAHMASSYDREGGNRDDRGFLREEGGWYVIAEMPGPGAITRIWSASPSGLIRFYIDQGSAPKIQIDFPDLFSGKVKPFVSPFVHAADSREGAHWSYIPIPFSRFCKVAVQQPGYYQIEYIAFPAEARMIPFEFPFSKKDEKRLSDVGKRFKVSNDIPFHLGAQTEEYSISHPIAAGERILLTTMEGPAIVRGFRMQWQGGKEEEGRNLMLRWYWDGERQPAVSVPLYDFFGGGVQTLALGRESSGWWYCYFPMPFEKMAYLEIENSSEQDSYELDLLLDLQRKVKLPANLRRFHAYWRRDNDTTVRHIDWNAERRELIGRSDENFIAFSTTGPGHLIGWGLQATPFAESDVMIPISPFTPHTSFFGTGHYGFFDLAGEFLTASWPVSGSIKKNGGRDFLFRSFIPAAIGFENEILVTLEHGSGNTLRKDYASTVYWYQENSTTASSPILPPGSRRFRTFDLQQPLLEIENRNGSLVLPFEAESLPVDAMLGIFDPQDMLPFGPDWSGNQQIRYEAFQAGGSIVFNLPRQTFSGWRRLRCRLTKDPDGAVVSVRVNDAEMNPRCDLFGEKIVPVILDSNRPVFLHAADESHVRFTVLDRNPDSEGYVVGVDSLEWIDSEQTPEVLELQGPFGLSADSVRTVTRTVLTEDGEPIFLGFVSPSEESARVTVISPDKGKDQFDLGSILASHKMEEALCLLTWTVSVEKVGIYHFELQPTDVTPFLFHEESGNRIPLNHRMLIGNIPIIGKDVLRYDPAAKRILPARYKIPLQEGENRLSWLIRCTPKTWIRPVFYGLSSDNK